MQEWKTYRIGDICKRVCSGGTPKSTEPSYYDGEIPWLNTKEINFNRISSTEKHITQSGLDNSSAKWIDKNSVIVAMYGATAAKVAINTIPLTTNQACCNLSIDETKADYRFVYYWLCSRYTELASLANGGAQQNLNAQQIKDFEIKLPEIQTQQKIADLLWSIDNKIICNKSINDNLEQQASHLFQDWINNCENSIRLRELTDNVLDYTPNTHDHVYLLNSSDVTEGQFTVLPLTPNINLKGQFKKRFKKGDILYSEIRPRNRHYAYCYFDADEYIASTRLIILRAKPEMLSSNILLYQYLMLNNVFEEFTLKTESRSGTFPQGNYEDLSSIKVPYGANQEEIATALESIYKQLWNNLEENERLEALRDSLLPKLMSGELKLNEIDC